MVYGLSSRFWIYISTQECYTYHQSISMDCRLILSMHLHPFRLSPATSIGSVWIQITRWWDVHHERHNTPGHWTRSFYLCSQQNMKNLSSSHQSQMQMPNNIDLRNLEKGAVFIWKQNEAVFTYKAPYISIAYTIIHLITTIK